MEKFSLYKKENEKVFHPKKLKAVEPNAITQVETAYIFIIFSHLFSSYFWYAAFRRIWHGPHGTFPPLHIVVPTYTSASTNYSIHSLCSLFLPSLKSIN